MKVGEPIPQEIIDYLVPRLIEDIEIKNLEAQILSECAKGKWLTNRSQIADADINSLYRSLLTGDGMGARFKLTVLHELIKRVTQPL